jgi:hypothetical protein
MTGKIRGPGAVGSSHKYPQRSAWPPWAGPPLDGHAPHLDFDSACIWGDGDGVLTVLPQRLQPHRLAAPLRPSCSCQHQVMPCKWLRGRVVWSHRAAGLPAPMSFCAPLLPSPPAAAHLLLPAPHLPPPAGATAQSARNSQSPVCVGDRGMIACLVTCRCPHGTQAAVVRHT